MIPLLENRNDLREFLEYCELAVEVTGNTISERGPLQLSHFRRIKHLALKNENTPVVVLLSEIAWKRNRILKMKCCWSPYSELFDAFNGNQTLWSFSGPPTLGNDPNQGLELPNKPASFSSWDEQWKTLNVDISNITGITKLTLTL